jgi:light-regulated signal transduction histidine kinase (bacteriophytochrome)
MRITPYRTEAGEVEGVVLTFVDLAAIEKVEEEALRQTQEELNRCAARLERSNAEVQELAFVASHELSEPLRTISSFCDLLAQRYGGSLDDQADKWIDFIMDGCRQMQQLIDDLTTYSRIHTRAKPPQNMKVAKVIDDVLVALRTSIDETGAVITHDELPTLVFERTHLKQLLRNLISNAIQYRGERTPRIHVSARCQGDEWILSVRDNGIGIKPEFHERVFEICKRLHSRGDRPGTGMGLAICRRIVERAGGRIWVESEPGEGSTFFFTVPKSPAV